jgi:hypothetical protein
MMMFNRIPKQDFKPSAKKKKKFGKIFEITK